MHILNLRSEIKKPILLAVVLIGLAIRLFQLTARPVWYDEAITIFNAKSSLSYIWTHFMRGSNPPFAYFFYHTWIRIFGESQFSFEMVSVFFGVLSIIAIYHLGKMMFNTTTGIAAAVLLSLSSYHLFVSQQIRGYSMACFFALISIYEMRGYIKKREQPLLAGWLISSFLMVGTHFYTFFLFASEFFTLVYFTRKKFKSMSLGIYYLIIFSFILGLSACLILAIKTFHIFPFFERPFATQADVQLVLQSIFFTSQNLALFSIVLVVFYFFYARRNKTNSEFNDVSFLIFSVGVSIGVPLIISQFVPSFFYVRYFIFSHLIWVVLVAAAIATIPKIWLRAVVLAIFISFQIQLLSAYYEECEWKALQKKGYEIVEERFKDGDVILHENGWTLGPGIFHHQKPLKELYLSDEFVLSMLRERQITPPEMSQYKRFWFFPENPGDAGALAKFDWLNFRPKKMIEQDPSGYWFLFEI